MLLFSNETFQILLHDLLYLNVDNSRETVLSKTRIPLCYIFTVMLNKIFPYKCDSPIDISFHYHKLILIKNLKIIWCNYSFLKLRSCMHRNSFKIPLKSDFLTVIYHFFNVIYIYVYVIYIHVNIISNEEQVLKLASLEETIKDSTKNQNVQFKIICMFFGIYKR